MTFQLEQEKMETTMAVMMSNRRIAALDVYVKVYRNPISNKKYLELTTESVAMLDRIKATIPGWNFKVTKYIPYHEQYDANEEKHSRPH